MKKVLIILLFLFVGGFAAKAQYVPVDGPLSYKWGGIYDSNKHRLSRSEANVNYFLVPEQQRKLKRGQNQYFWGAGLFATGFAANAFSVGLMEGSSGTGNDTVDGFIFAFAYCYGIPSMIGGLTLFFTGRHKMKDLTEDYNYARQNRGDVSLSFGPQQYGYGLALTF